MSYTKYLMNDANEFVMVSKYSGQEHIHLAHFIGGPAKMSHAGFLYRNDQTIQSYGKSVSTGLSSREEDGELIQQSLLKGEMVIVFIEQGDFDFYCASNHPSLKNHPDAQIATLDLLEKYRIFERDL